MKKLLLSLLLVCTVTIASSQNYWQAYPLVAQVTSNGGQQRIEVSVYDSLLQSWVYYNTPYYPCSLAIQSNNNGMMTFNSWVNANNQDSIFGYLVYDYELLQFKPVISSFNVANDFYINSGITWVTYEEVEDWGNGESFNYRHYAKYDIKSHAWKVVTHNSYEDIFCGTGGGTTMTGVRWNINHCNDAGIYWIYDPAVHAFGQGGSGCAGWYFEAQDDYLVVDSDCGTEYGFETYDPSLHSWQSYQRYGLIGDQNNGIIHASDLNSDWEYFGVYDEMLNQWMIDSTDHTLLQIKDRVAGYIDTTSTPDRMHYLAYSPTLHSWVKDSTDAPGINSFTIQEGTISWADFSGSHIRGYNDTTGWGNYSTPLFLNFYLTDLSSPANGNLIHVRNYSIGTDSVKYDFGDGITSIGNTRVLWHLYRTAGPFNVCITNNSGTQSSCQTVSFVSCSVSGTASSASDSICIGDSTLLTLSGFTGTIQWQSNIASSGTWVNETGPGSTSDTYQVSPLVATYYRTIVTDSACSSALSNIVSVTTGPFTTAVITPNGPLSFCQGGSVLLSANSGTGLAYQWTKNGSSIAGAASQNYLATTAGMYRAIISNASCIDTSLSVTVTVPCKPVEDPELKTENENSEEINPELFVYYHSLEQTAFISAQKLKGKNYVLHVYDLLGKELVKENGKLNSEDFTKDLNCTLFAKGMYLVSLETEKDKLIKRFVKD